MHWGVGESQPGGPGIGSVVVHANSGKGSSDSGKSTSACWSVRSGLCWRNGSRSVGKVL